MTPRQVIKNECQYCMNSTRRHCDSIDCNLSKLDLTHIKRIKAHCLECVPEQSHDGVKKCAGKVIAVDGPRLCPLYPFRLGKNPKRKGGAAPHLKDYHFPSRHTQQEATLGIKKALKPSKCINPQVGV